jgi:DNA-binding transcriptional LysR family regulator
MGLMHQQLEAFMAVVKVGTVRGAATSLFISQTAVTQRLQNLEKKIKTPLFIRSKRGMALTPEGEILLRYCQACQDLEKGLFANIQGVAESLEVEIRILATSSIMATRIIGPCSKLTSKYENLVMHYEADNSTGRANKLRAGEADFAVLERKNVAKEMQTKQLASEQYVLACSPEWKGRKLKEIVRSERVIDYRIEDEATFDYLREYDLLDDVVCGRHLVNSHNGLVRMVSEGYGYTVFSKELADRYVNEGKLMLLNQGKAIEQERFLAWFDRPGAPDYF